jgi:hypothetical protein
MRPQRGRPASSVTTASRNPDDRDPRLAERCELYIGGIEIANAISELTDSGLTRSGETPARGGALRMAFVLRAEASLAGSAA